MKAIKKALFFISILFIIVVTALPFICHPRCHPKQKMGYGLNRNPLF